VKPLREGCKGKIAYASHAEAEAARHNFIKDRRKSGGGRALRKLHCYFCDECTQFHIGHDSRKGVAPWKPETPKAPTTGQLRRRLRKIETMLEGEKLNRLYQISKIMAAQQQAEAEAEARRAEVAARVADLADSIRIANQL
jgi:hypothetical protein